MVKKIWRLADSKLRRVIRFLTARNMKAADIPNQICEMFSDNAMSDSKVRKLTSWFKEDREKVDVKPRSGRPSVITDDLVQAIDTQIHANRRFTISKLLSEFQQVSRLVLF
ncbi:hypothetical protein AVEN_47552-1 [Araneus ventricosus]|uniref:Mos1 transposase HTH domain-containing protein n=1 Tax=Araneus ventricosus TaxID=182803 RepID=A0A4Y2TMT1_ARAVE|nr:hypothetical protein AVEN_47552-1 [Araneus ventricosus]